MGFEEGLCQICKHRPAAYQGLMCHECRAAIDNGEP